MTHSMPINRRDLLAAAAMVTGASAAAGPADATSPQPDLSGVSILITGCSSGFGRLGAEHYARLGAKVFATMRNIPRPEAEELRILADAEGLDIEVIEIDVTKRRQVRRGVARALEAAGGSLDVLINNAGIAYGGTVELMDERATREMFDTNVFGPQRMTREVLPAMRSNGRGLIVNISSQLGRVILPGFSVYSPTKFALEALSEQMAFEVAGHGIDVSIVQPGGYPTKIWDNARALTERLLKRTPDALEEAYAPFLEGLASRGGGSTDPMDVPRAIAGIVSAPAGQRPLRLPVHPGARPQLAINAASAATQRSILERSGMGAVASKLYE